MADSHPDLPGLTDAPHLTASATKPPADSGATAAPSEAPATGAEAPPTGPGNADGASTLSAQRYWSAATPPDVTPAPADDASAVATSDAGAPENRERRGAQAERRTHRRRIPCRTASGACPRFGRYELLEELSRSPMGVVYRARLVDFPERVVALKVLHAAETPENERVVRFEREVQHIAALRHPNIVAVYDVGTHAGWTFFTMAFIPGESLAERIARLGVLSQQEATTLGVKIARALHEAHRHGIIHRDVKPSNILLDAGSGEPMLCDFGLAKDVESDVQITRSGMTLGTPPYMPPEQARGQHDRLDSRTDVYALGATLYECVTARPPFTGETGMQVLLQVLEKAPPKPHRKNPTLSPDLEAIILKAMRKRPLDRYQNAALLAEDLERFARGDWVVARRATVLTRFARFVRAYRLFVLTLLSVFLVAAGILIASYFERETYRQPVYTPHEDVLLTEAFVKEYWREIHLPSDEAPEADWQVQVRHAELWLPWLPMRDPSDPVPPSLPAFCGIGLAQPLGATDFRLSANFEVVLGERHNANLGWFLVPTEDFEGAFAYRPAPGATRLDRVLTPRHPALAKGYLLELGADGNTRSVLSRDGVEVYADGTLRLEPGVYQLTITRRGARLDIAVIDEQRRTYRIVYEDDFPLRLMRGGYFGFTTRHASVLISALSLATIAPAARELDRANRVFALGVYEEALVDYEQKRRFAKRRGERALALEALFRQALCRERLAERTRDAALERGAEDPWCEPDVRARLKEALDTYAEVEREVAGSDPVLSPWLDRQWRLRAALCALKGSAPTRVAALETLKRLCQEPALPDDVRRRIVPALIAAADTLAAEQHPGEARGPGDVSTIADELWGLAERLAADDPVQRLRLGLARATAPWRTARDRHAALAALWAREQATWRQAPKPVADLLLVLWQSATKIANGTSARRALAALGRIATWLAPETSPGGVTGSPYVPPTWLARLQDWLATRAAPPK